MLKLIIELSGRVVKVADCKSTCPGFESMLMPLVTCARALNKFSLKSACLGPPSRISRYQLSGGGGGVILKDQLLAYKLFSLAITIVK